MLTRPPPAAAASCVWRLPPPRGGFGDDAIRVDRPHPSRLLRDLGEGQEPLVVHRVHQRLAHQPHVPERGDGRVSQDALPHLLRDRIRAAPKIRRVRSRHRVEDGRLPALLPLLLGAFVFFSLILCFSRYSTGSYLFVSFLSSGDVLCLFPGDSSSFASSAVRSTVSGLTIIEDALVKSEEPPPALDAPAIARLADLNPPRGFRSVPEAVEKPVAPAPPPRAGTAPGASFATAGGASGFGSGFGSAPANPKTANEREEGDGSTWRHIGRGERSSGRGRPRAGATSWARGVAPANDRCPGSGLSFLGGMGAREIDSDPRTSSSPALAAVVTTRGWGCPIRSWGCPKIQLSERGFERPLVNARHCRGARQTNAPWVSSMMLASPAR